MFNFFFKKTESDGVDIEVSTDVKTIAELKKKAADESNDSFRRSLKHQIKQKLFEKYGVESCNFMYRHNLSYKEAELIDRIINEMIDRLGLMKDEE